jgi:hypothetical protein
MSDLLVLGAVEQEAEDLHFAVREAIGMPHFGGLVTRHGRVYGCRVV